MKTYKTIETASKKALEIVNAEYDLGGLVEATIHRAEESQAFHNGSESDRRNAKGRFSVRLYSHDIQILIPYAHQGIAVSDRRSDFHITKINPVK